MLFTKTEINVLKLFVSRILDSFTIREVSRMIKKDLKIVHVSIKQLIDNRYFIQEKHNGLKLNYKQNISDLAYIENIRKEEFYRKNKIIKLYINKFIEKTKHKFFILLIFGSYASGKQTKKSDIDLLAVIPKYDENFERELKATLSSSISYFHVNVINTDSFYEMLKKREELNIVNETLNNHILLYGAENYYAFLSERTVK